MRENVKLSARNAISKIMTAFAQWRIMAIETDGTIEAIPGAAKALKIRLG